MASTASATHGMQHFRMHTTTYPGTRASAATASSAPKRHAGLNSAPIARTSATSSSPAAALPLMSHTSTGTPASGSTTLAPPAISVARSSSTNETGTSRARPAPVIFTYSATTSVAVCVTSLAVCMTSSLTVCVTTSLAVCVTSTAPPLFSPAAALPVTRTLSEACLTNALSILFDNLSNELVKLCNMSLVGAIAYRNVSCLNLLLTKDEHVRNTVK